MLETGNKYIVKILSETNIEFGTLDKELINPVIINTDKGNFIAEFEDVKDAVEYNVSHGIYCIRKTKGIQTQLPIQICGFNYTFERNYGALNYLDHFKKNADIKKHEHPILSKFPFTIGLEYETCSGAIPENVCRKTGLIPLRDGSISGHEYSSIVMDFNNMPMVEEQLQALKKYTNYNKECSIHLNFGNFPMTPEYLFNVYTLCMYVQGDLHRYLPKWSFATSKYKKSTKNYSSKLYFYTSFKEMYAQASGGTAFLGSLFYPNPLDPTKNHKWNISSRYHWVNFVNAMFYPKGKTIEFRNIVSTYNIEFLESYMYIYSAILYFAMKYPEKIKNVHNIDDVVREVYTRLEYNVVKRKMLKLYNWVLEMDSAGDFSGTNLYIQDKYFKNE